MAPRPTPFSRRRPTVLALVVAWTLVLAACTGDDSPNDAAPDPAPTESTVDSSPTDAAGALPPLSRLQIARNGGRPAIVDEQGREVLLRGANLNSLGDYYQAYPAFAPTRPPTDEDWDQMAAHGFSVVRLVVSWSALEPERGQIDLAYVQRIQQAVAAAAERRIYTVIDMHQDAWGKFIASPPGVVCPPDTEPAIGWDGAPLWATLTDGADTCRPIGNREGSPAVQAAFNSFYDNRDGIRDAFVATWGVLAQAFADEPAVAGYDLFNEPNLIGDAPTSERRYTELMAATVAEVREAELAAGGFPHVIFLEPVVLFPLPGTMPTDGFTFDDQIAFAPHNYAEVIGPQLLTVEQTFDVSADAAGQRGWPLWIGEHGVYATDEATLDVLDRFARAQDEHLAGGAQWQWRQWCGDPHSIGVPGRIPTERQVQLNDVDCPADVDAGPNTELLSVAGRAYPRAVPGLLTELMSDPDARTMAVEGRIVDDLAAVGDLVLWIPGSERPDVSGDGVGEPVIREVPGGWYATMAVDDTPYRVEVA
ncbi:MAG: glycoside hydrolase family 5 protein [Iamia sp.]